jgi:hypothetical protein
MGGEGKKRHVTCFEKGCLVLEKNALLKDCFYIQLFFFDIFFCPFFILIFFVSLTATQLKRLTFL